MKEILLVGRRKTTLVDNDVYEWAKDFSWVETQYGYVVTNVPKGKERLHRLVMKAEKGQEIDHVNGNKLDNRRCNLRFVTRQQNNQNKKTYRTSKTGYPGIYKAKNGRWVASIKFHGKRHHLGTHDTFVEAMAFRVTAERLLGFTVPS